MAEVLWCWRHAKVPEAARRCIGRTDLPIHRRRAKRLAHRIRALARREGLPREVWSSPQRRCLATAQQLRAWGWKLHVDARLVEMDFGDWEGRAWRDIAWLEVQAWEQNFLHHAPAGGESLWHLAQRALAFAGDASAPRIVLSHGGWINALQHVPPGCTEINAALWPAPLKPGTGVRWPTAGGLNVAPAHELRPCARALGRAGPPRPAGWPKPPTSSPTVCPRRMRRGDDRSQTTDDGCQMRGDR